MRLVELIGFVGLAGLLLCAVVIAQGIRSIRARLGDLNAMTAESTGGIRRLVEGVNEARVEHRKNHQSDRQTDAARLMDLGNDLRGCRNSIDAIRTVADELSEHRRDTVEVRHPSKLLASTPA